MTYWRMTEPPGGSFQGGTRESKTGLSYSTSLAALTDAGNANNFFTRSPESLEALAVEAARLAYLDVREDVAALSNYLKRVNLELVANPFDDGNTQAYLAECSHLRLLAFRGSDDLKAWQTNIRGLPVMWQGPGEVHEGFAEAFEAAWPEIGKDLTRSNGRPLIITGHSLGGALATLAAVHCPQALVYTFGAPRVGNQAFAHAFAARGQQLHRFVNHRDPVPLLPPGFIGYRHVGLAYYIDKVGTVRAMPPLKRRKTYKDMRQVLNQIMDALNQPKSIPRSDLTDHSPLNYVSALK
ncbi:MAG: lipase family protein [Kiloniellales bacterium]|nr:lipase family protein [Kiloniellales bacterium]